MMTRTDPDFAHRPPSATFNAHRLLNHGGGRTKSSQPTDPTEARV